MYLTTKNQAGPTTPAGDLSVSSTSFESLLTLAQAAQILPRINGRQLTAATVWRWCRKGINGIYLEHQCVGRAIVTTQPALDRFFRRLAEKDQPHTTASLGTDTRMADNEGSGKEASCLNR